MLAVLALWLALGPWVLLAAAGAAGRAAGAGVAAARPGGCRGPGRRGRGADRAGRAGPGRLAADPARPAARWSPRVRRPARRRAPDPDGRAAGRTCANGARPDCTTTPGPPTPTLGRARSGSRRGSTPRGSALEECARRPSTPTTGWSRSAATCTGPRCTSSTPRLYEPARHARRCPTAPPAEPWERLRRRRVFYLDDEDRAVVATTDRRVLVVGTSDAEGDPDLTTGRRYDLERTVPAGRLPGRAGARRDGGLWCATQQGRVGTIAPGRAGCGCSTSTRTVANSLAVDQDGASTSSRPTRSTGSTPGAPGARGDLADVVRPGQRAEVRPAQPGQRHHADPAAGRAGRDHRQRRPADARGVLRHRERRPVCQRPSSGTTRAPPRARWSRSARASSWRTTTGTAAR